MLRDETNWVRDTIQNASSNDPSGSSPRSGGRGLVMGHSSRGSQSSLAAIFPPKTGRKFDTELNNPCQPAVAAPAPVCLASGAGSDGAAAPKGRCYGNLYFINTVNCDKRTIKILVLLKLFLHLEQLRHLKILRVALRTEPAALVVTLGLH